MKATAKSVNFILGFCILMRVFNQGYEKKRQSQQFVKVFYFKFYILPLHVSAHFGHLQEENC
jgi:hypothetical protein